MSRNLYDLLGLVSSVAFILALKGLSSPKSARRGNLIGAIGAGLAAIGFGVLLGTVANTQEQSAPFGATSVVVLAASRKCSSKMSPRI